MLVIACGWGSSALAQEQPVSEPTASRFPVVVVEREASFSIPSAAAQPATPSPPTRLEPFAPKEKYQRNAKPILAGTELISEGFLESVVQITGREQENLALGTVVGKLGHVLTKYSLVKETPSKRLRFLYKELKWSGTLVGYDEKEDLALFELHSGERAPELVLKPVTFSTDGRLANGKIVIGVGTDSQTLAVGMTTLAPTTKAMEPDCETCVDMGITLTGNLTLSRVYPRTVGERLGLLVGDRLISVNNRPVVSVAEFTAIEKSVRAGDLISIRFQRRNVVREITEQVPALTKATKRDRWGGGPFSKRRGGFSEVLVHDSVISPEDCGGPLVNLQGQFCGVNIARSMRVASYAIPAELVKEFVFEHLPAAEVAADE